jgi:hypothetical protein
VSSIRREAVIEAGGIDLPGSVSRPWRETAGRSAQLGAVAMVMASLLGTWLLSGVTIGEAFSFMAFECGYVLLPGCLLYVSLSPEPGGWLRIVAIGWPCGYAIEVTVFAVSAALHVRGAFSMLPVVTIAVLVVLFYLGRRGAYRSRLRVYPSEGGVVSGRRVGIDGLVVAAAISVALILLSFTFFAPAPLPRNAASVVYSVDNVFDISLAAEAHNHWPITEPWVAGQPFRYYTAVFIHVAAISQVTGVEPSTIVLRLLPSTLLLLSALQLWSLGRALGRSRWIGPVGVFLFAAVQDINLNPLHSELLRVSPFNQFSLSPTFAFGVPFFLALLILMQSRIIHGSTFKGMSSLGTGNVFGNGTKRALALLILLVMGAAAAKTFAAACFLGGLGLFWLWSVIKAKQEPIFLWCIILSLVALAVIYFVMLAGDTTSNLTLHPGDFLTNASIFSQVRATVQPTVGNFGFWVLLIAGGCVVAVCALAPLLGVLLLVRIRWDLPPIAGLLLCMFVAGTFGYVLFRAPGGVEGVFFVYGYIAILPLSAMGLVGLLQDLSPRRRWDVFVGCATLGGLGLMLACVTSIFPSFERAHHAWSLIAYATLAGALAATVARQAPLYKPLVTSRSACVAACCIPLLTSLGVVKPAMSVLAGAWKTITGEQMTTTNSSIAYGMTAALYKGLLWVRHHTDTCDVLAVNNHYDSAHGGMPAYFYYSAFAERRVFLESWLYTPNGIDSSQPFPARARLNAEAVQEGRPAALLRLADEGVSYVLIDKLHGGGMPGPPSVSHLVFSDSALAVYRLASRHDNRIGGKCGTPA